jgi:hypothetical protein
MEKAKVFNTPKEIVEYYFPNRISDTCGGGVIGCPYEQCYSGYINLLENECTKYCKGFEAGKTPDEICGECWNQQLK